jgi:hypothetical protein
MSGRTVLSEPVSEAVELGDISDKLSKTIVPLVVSMSTTAFFVGVEGGPFTRGHGQNELPKLVDFRYCVFLPFASTGLKMKASPVRSYHLHSLSTRVIQTQVPQHARTRPPGPGGTGKSWRRCGC